MSVFWPLSQREIEEYAAELLHEPEVVVAEPEPVSEDRQMLLDRIEADSRAHEPVTEQQRFDSLSRLLGEKTARDWNRFHDQ